MSSLSLIYIVLGLAVLALILRITLGWPLSPIAVAGGLFVVWQSRKDDAS